MPARPRYSLKAVLVSIAVLSVPLAMFLVVGGCLGYLIGGRERVGVGVGIGAVGGIVFACVIPIFWTA